MKRLIASMCLLIVLPLALFGRPQEKPASQRDLKESCHKFVQEFYDWYLAEALNKIEAPRDRLVLIHKRHALSVELYRALKADFDAQANAQEIVGMDFDPFTNSQDACEKYAAGETVQAGEGFRVAVYGICEGKKHQKPDLVAELKFENGHWVFLNFHYANCYGAKGCDLSGILRNLKREREVSSPK